MDVKIIFILLLVVISPIIPADTYDTTFYAEGTILFSEQMDYISNSMELTVINGYATGQAIVKASEEGYESVTYMYTFTGDMENNKITGIGTFSGYKTDLQGYKDIFPDYPSTFKAGQKTSSVFFRDWFIKSEIKKC